MTDVISDRSSGNQSFDLAQFLPYLLSQAAETASLNFQTRYKPTYNMLRTEWRVLAHLGRHGDMTATEIGAQAKVHKTKISRAVAALEKKRWVVRHDSNHDRRVIYLSLTASGRRVYREVSNIAVTYNEELAAQFTEEEVQVLKKCLTSLGR